MAEASSRLDINLEASGRINSIMFISILEVNKKNKGNNHKRWVLRRSYKNIIDVEKSVAFLRKEEKLILLLHPESFKY